MNVNYYTDTLGQSRQRDMTKYTVPLSLSAMAERDLSYKQAIYILTIINDYYMIATL